MKHQSMKDRMHEGEGMVRHMMHKHHMQHESHANEHGMKGGYKHQVDEPRVPAEGHMESGWGCASFKDQADPISYGQAGVPGCRSDEKKMHSQFKDYHWD